MTDGRAPDPAPNGLASAHSPSADADPGAPHALDSSAVLVGLSLSLAVTRARADVPGLLAEAEACLLDALEALDRPADSRVDRALLARAALRDAIFRALAHEAVRSGVVWSVRDELARQLAALDDRLDQDLRALLADEPSRPDALEDVARYLAAVTFAPERLSRALSTLWSALEPPRARRAARMIDLAALCFGPARGAVYRFLAREGVDVRGVLSGDPFVDPTSRVEALSVLSLSREHLRPLPWGDDPAHAMARLLADWTRYVTHPRVLFFLCARRVGAAAWAPLLDAIDRWPLAPEAREELLRQRERTPARVVARALGPGRFACGRCDERGVRAVRRWAADAPSDADDPRAGEVEFVCPDCALRYFAAWDSDTLGEPEPEAWVVA